MRLLEECCDYNLLSSLVYWFWEVYQIDRALSPVPFYTCYLAEQVPVCARLQFVLVLLAAEENSEFVLGTSQGCLGTSWHVLAAT